MDFGYEPSVWDFGYSDPSMDFGGDWGFSSPEMMAWSPELMDPATGWGGFDQSMGGLDMGGGADMGGMGMNVPEYDFTSGGTPSQWLQMPQQMSIPQQQGSGLPFGITGNQLGLGVQGLGALTGLAGVIQALGGGNREQKTTTTRQVPEASPKQQELQNQTINTLANIQQQAQNAELQRAISEMARGNLAISPNLVDQVTSAFTKQAGDIARGSVNNARERGFAGGLDLISGAGAPVYSDQMAQLQSDISRQLVNLAMGLPAQASQMNQQMVQGMGMGAQQSNQLASLMQQAQLAGTGSQEVRQGPKPGLLDVMGPFSATMGAFGSAGSGLAQLLGPQQQPAAQYYQMPTWLSQAGGKAPTASGG